MSELIAPIEVSTKYVTSVESIGAAWTFVMEHIDQVGPRPRIVISPVTIFSASDFVDAPHQEVFEVLVEGMVHQEGDVR